MVIPGNVAPVTGTTLRANGLVPADSRQYVCVYVWSCSTRMTVGAHASMGITYSRVWINRVRLPSVVS